MKFTRLRFFTIGLLLLAFICLGMNIFNLRSGYDVGLSYFTGTVILMASGFELVRNELEKANRKDSDNK